MTVWAILLQCSATFEHHADPTFVRVSAKNYHGPDHLLQEAGIEVVVLNTEEAISLSDASVVDALN